MNSTRTLDWAGEELRETILVRSGGVCECCGNTRYESLHHRTPRGMGGSHDEALNSPANITGVCGSGTTGCHGRIEISRIIATTYGWLVRHGMDPEITPIAYRGRWALLGDDGFVDYVPPAETLRLPDIRQWRGRPRAPRVWR